MKILFITLISFLVAAISFCQHCPWDCAGMILLKTNIPKAKFDRLNIVLADSTGYGITDTMYGTGKETYDACELLAYEDFLQLRKEKIKLHHWYRYDTLYRFAEGLYLVKFNYCEYKSKKLYIKFLDAYNRSAKYHYVEIPDSLRIHLHDYSSKIFEKETAELKQLLQSFILYFDCDRWLLQKEDCE